MDSIAAIRTDLAALRETLARIDRTDDLILAALDTHGGEPDA